MPDFTSNLKLLLRLNETSGTSIADTSPLGLTGTWQGTAISTVAGPFAGSTAPSFNGTNNYIAFADSANNHDFIGSWTFAAWAKTSTGSTLALAGKNDVAFSSGWDVLINGGSLNTVCRPVGLNHAPADPNFNDNLWHHVCETLTFSGGAVLGRYYLDGALVHTSGGGVPTAWTPVPNVDALHIGARRGAIFWSGALKEVRLYDRALSDTDVLDLFLSTNGIGNPRVNPRTNPRANPRFNPH